MKTKVWNGEYWYFDKRPLLMRVRQWLIWVGGWEHGNRRDGHNQWRPFRYSQVDHRWHVKSPTPLSFFGHRITFQWFGVDVRRRRDYLCWHWRQRSFDRPGKGYAYLSHNATPWGAHHWFWGWEKYHGIDETNGPG